MLQDSLVAVVRFVESAVDVVWRLGLVGQLD